MSPQVDDQLVIRDKSSITLSTNLNIFFVNISMSNYGGEFSDAPSFVFGENQNVA